MNRPHRHQCLGRPHATPQTAALLVHTLSHSYAANSPLATMGHPQLPQNYPFPWTNPTPASSLDPSNLPSQTASISQSAVLPQCTGQTEQTNRWLEETFYDYRSLSLYRECCSIIIMQNICHFTVTPYTMSH